MLDLLSRIWSLGKKIDEVLDLNIKTRKALEILDERLSKLEDRVTYLEADRDRVIIEAKAAASAASATVASSIISDVVTRITRVEMGAEQLIKRLPPPS